MMASSAVIEKHGGMEEEGSPNVFLMHVRNVTQGYTYYLWLSSNVINYVLVCT